MSGIISRATSALAAVHNEFSPSLATLNFDFTLVKLDAPPEYHEVGKTISERRRVNAEDGSVHRTARKLGALFESCLPPTPELYKAYGTRVSEISRSKLVNPQPTPRDGMFAGQVGADSTSLWAAVTSGDGAIGVHLLACLLARIWPGPEATSIWSELVIARKDEIHRQAEAATFPSEHNKQMLAAMQEISRKELATWDASARSWIQSADQVKIREHTQLRLILGNRSLPVPPRKDLYSSVTSAWFSALQAMNNLVKGIPQQVQDGAALLGMSSWHLYPDMVVLGDVTVKVEQNDKLFLPSTFLTLGLQFIDNSRRSVSWSLSLAHLKYYGHPVQSNHSFGTENSRVSIDQFGYIMLGCVFGGWKEYASTADIGLKWLLKIPELLERFPKRLGNTLPIAIKVAMPLDDDSLAKLCHDVLRPTSWMGWLFNAAQRLSESEGVERQLGMQLLALGRRRCASLSSNNACPAPLFGLSKPSILLPIIIDEDSRIEFLRDFAHKLNLDNSTHIIRYRRVPKHSICRYEYATIQPRTMNSTEPDCDQDQGSCESSDAPHARWLPIYTYYLPNSGVLSCACITCLESCPCRARNTECSVLCHNRGASTRCGNNDYLGHLRKRSDQIFQSGEDCFPIIEMAPYQASIGPKDILIKIGVGKSFDSALYGLSREGSKTPLRNFIGLTLVVGDNASAAIFAFDFGRNVVDPRSSEPPSTSDMLRGHLRPQVLEKALNPRMLDLERLLHWLTRFELPKSKNEGQQEIPLNAEEAEAQLDGYQNYTTSLRTCAAASEVYKLLPDSTISTMVVSQPLWKSKWMPKQPRGMSHLIPGSVLSRAQVFACIAMFDSGTCSLDPESLREAFAMSTGNSIFVAAPLLCDPYEIPRQCEVRRVIGNIGRPGITMLVPPAEPKKRPPDDENWRLITHAPFEGKLEDCFQQTTIHLGFTEYDMPLSDGLQGNHIIDRTASLVETLVSVHDRGQWIADLDVLAALGQKRGRDMQLHSSACTCQEAKDIQHAPHKRKYNYSFEDVFGNSKVPLISLDSWEEFLDAPSDGVLIVRAHQNWLARLAFTVMSVSCGRRTLVLPAEVCWHCCKSALEGSQREDASSSILIC